MKYSLTCPACSQDVVVEAATDKEAFDKILVEGKTHGEKYHADMPPMPEEQMKELVRTGMKKIDQTQ